MYEIKSGVGRKIYVVYTDLSTGERIESQPLKSRSQANAWITAHVRDAKSSA